MPLPKPKAQESEKQFIERCMSDSIMTAEYKTSEQRYAVCSVEWKRAKK